jgi:hypothetical protein
MVSGRPLALYSALVPPVRSPFHLTAASLEIVAVRAAFRRQWHSHSVRHRHDGGCHSLTGEERVNLRCMGGRRASATAWR